jgi:hypothetical protein
LPGFSTSLCVFIVNIELKLDKASNHITRFQKRVKNLKYKIDGTVVGLICEIRFIFSFFTPNKFALPMTPPPPPVVRPIPAAIVQLPNIPEAPVLPATPSRVVYGPFRYNPTITLQKPTFSKLETLRTGFGRNLGLFRAITASYYATSK